MQALPAEAFFARGLIGRMEYRVRPQQETDLITGAKPAEPFESGFSEVLTLLKRNRAVITAAILSSLLVGSAYLLVTPPQYTATALILIDSRSHVIPSSQVRSIDANAESAYVETQVGILKSERMARMVISEHRLHERAEFKEKPSFLSQASAQSSEDAQGEPATPLALERVPGKAVKEFGRRMGIKRSQSTHIIDVSFTHEDPQVAADIANTIVRAYLNDRLSAREEAIRSMSTWLEQRALDLRRQTQAAQTALDEFRNSNAAIGNSRSVLRDLESTAQTYRLISESFHKQFLETSQEQHFSPLDARFLSEAWTPAERSQPRRSLVLATAGSFGLAIGFLIALFRGDGRKQPIILPRDFSPMPRLDPARPMDGDKTAFLPNGAKTAVRALQQAIHEVGNVPPASSQIPQGVRVVSVSAWRGYACRMGISSSDKERARQQAFNRAYDVLKESGHIGIWDQQVWITATGERGGAQTVDLPSCPGHAAKPAHNA